ncbi:hypothetical protein BWQ96_00721 [Gracilariopsis chorda]|uniref:Uncharacterized protein n=1 Tax=Gracilariopsis chorda TaxID=448386 RepID=A0A2V3J4T8_9FLOR|nr:hypothetical protein BWQ96_00721 [Gracilariopsis chorda]|eukprot:PXF49405.1 hypothetical protein BWQ96_00721 [Gracilariopsis chorda]
MKPPADEAQSRRCGMCGACDSMPPWAPERLRNATPEERAALEKRMREKQRLFIEQRDARLRRTKAAQQDSLPLVSSPIRVEPKNEEQKISQPKPQENPMQAVQSLPWSDLSSTVEERASPSHALQQNEFTPHVDNSTSPPSPPKRLPLHRTAPEEPPQNPTEVQSAKQPQEQDPSSPSAAPMRTISLQDFESDVDSFHTAEDEDLHTPLPTSPQHETAHPTLSHSPKPVHSPLHVQSIHPTSTEPNLRPTTLSDPISDPLQTNKASQQSQTSDDFRSLVSENLEETVIARRRRHRNHSRENSLAILDDYQLPADLLPLRSDASLDRVIPQPPCVDCERWRTRVQELELKIEALTSALTALEMESSTMRARTAARTQRLPKTAAQLAEECESLRVTTQFLYHKLERYERAESDKERRVS